MAGTRLWIQSIVVIQLICLTIWSLYYGLCDSRSSTGASSTQSRLVTPADGGNNDSEGADGLCQELSMYLFPSALDDYELSSLPSSSPLSSSSSSSSSPLSILHLWNDIASHLRPFFVHRKHQNSAQQSQRPFALLVGQISDEYYSSSSSKYDEVLNHKNSNHNDNIHHHHHSGLSLNLQPNEYASNICQTKQPGEDNFIDTPMESTIQEVISKHPLWICPIMIDNNDCEIENNKHRKSEFQFVISQSSLLVYFQMDSSISTEAATTSADTTTNDVNSTSSPPHLISQSQLERLTSLLIPTYADSLSNDLHNKRKEQMFSYPPQQLKIHLAIDEDRLATQTSTIEPTVDEWITVVDQWINENKFDHWPCIDSVETDMFTLPSIKEKSQSLFSSPTIDSSSGDTSTAKTLQDVLVETIQDSIRQDKSDRDENSLNLFIFIPSQDMDDGYTNNINNDDDTDVNDEEASVIEENESSEGLVTNTESFEHDEDDGHENDASDDKDGGNDDAVDDHQEENDVVDNDATTSGTFRIQSGVWKTTQIRGNEAILMIPPSLDSFTTTTTSNSGVEGDIDASNAMMTNAINTWLASRMGIPTMSSLSSKDVNNNINDDDDHVVEWICDVDNSISRMVSAPSSIENINYLLENDDIKNVNTFPKWYLNVYYSSLLQNYLLPQLEEDYLIRIRPVLLQQKQNRQLFTMSSSTSSSSSSQEEHDENNSFFSSMNTNSQQAGRLLPLLHQQILRTMDGWFISSESSDNMKDEIENKDDNNDDDDDDDYDIVHLYNQLSNFYWNYLYHIPKDITMTTEFPIEHYAAIFAPLLFPLIIPMLVGLIKELHRYYQKKK